MLNASEALLSLTDTHSRDLIDKARDLVDIDFAARILRSFLGEDRGAPPHAEAPAQGGER